MLNKVELSKRIPSLDGLRAISIILVIVDHAYKANLKNIKIGKIGVGVFFVISSYLIISMLLREVEKGTFSVKRFYFKRIMRIFPAYYFCMLITFAIILFLGFFELNQFWRPLVFLENYHPRSLWKNNWLIGHTWSLAAEEQFYVLISSLFFIFKKSDKYKNNLLYSFFAILILAPLLRGSYIVFMDYIPIVFKQSIYRSFETVMDSFAIGGIIAVIGISKLKNNKIVAFFKNKNLFLFLIILLIQFSNSPFIREIFGLKIRFLYNILGLPTIYLFIGIILINSVTATNETKLYRFLNNKTLSYIGVLSYSLYLWQQVWLDSWNLPTMVKFLGIFITAVIFYYLIEVPFLNLRAKMLKK